ncbi:ABC transporter ATP-binding protein [Paenibacillus sp. JX-17]|uniref:ABC transporter ATP-binding protein n=1 Tax=Paenibacillus lacisoli TaxID=3064525 RepID=A0ABT9CCN4_9BACL|nr:ABC transporter ATP-binding protein [Paenibacillus sp. JX-17]MDO7906640.1 ABC transporter ATP-binding protein [Paenibacillus sp. JX-17]
MKASIDTAAEYLIELKGVFKARSRQAIGPLDLKLPAGYVVALVGQNGSGKSTLMNLMTQLIQPDAGELRWFGESYPEGLPPEVRQRIGYVPENFSVEENRMTVEQAAEFRSYWYPDWDQARFEALLDRFKVPRGTKLSKMSKGERRKFEIAAALAPHPRLLLLDEPSSGFDPFAWKIMLEELRACLEEDGTTILLATHIVDEIKRLADYIVLIHRGRILGRAEKDSLMESWKEIWFEGSAEDAADLPGVAEHSEEGSGLQRVVTMEAAAAGQLIAQSGLRLLRTRNLELDDILSYWIAGRVPSGIEHSGEGEGYQ